jgi:hypothetical protein
MPITFDAPGTAIDLGALTRFLDSLQSYSADLVQDLPTDKKLCHYTTLDGAIGIIDRQDLWMSNSRFSNDDSELVYGRGLIEDQVASLARRAEANPDRKKLLEDVRKRIKAVSGENVYVACFCERDNLLSQWRGYADNGGGVSIEFEPTGFQLVTGPDSPHGGLMRLWKVFYSETQQRRIVSKCIDYPGWPDDDFRARRIIDVLQFFLPTFKKEDFSEEEERRLIFSPKTGMAHPPRFRDRGGMLVPYFSLKELADPGGINPLRLPIARVVVGPGRHKELNVESLRMLLESKGYTDVPVVASSTPYRG